MPNFIQIRLELFESIRYKHTYFIYIQIVSRYNISIECESRSRLRQISPTQRNITFLSSPLFPIPRETTTICSSARVQVCKVRQCSARSCPSVRIPRSPSLTGRWRCLSLTAPPRLRPSRYCRRSELTLTLIGSISLRYVGEIVSSSYRVVNVNCKSPLGFWCVFKYFRGHISDLQVSCCFLSPCKRLRSVLYTKIWGFLYQDSSVPAC